MCVFQYHKDRVSSRDKSIVTTSSQISLTAYTKAPFNQDQVDQFLEEFKGHRNQVKRKADAEKVSPIHLCEWRFF